MRLTYEFDRPTIERFKDFDRLNVKGLPLSGCAGEPLLPRRLARILLPAGASAASVEVAPSAAEEGSAERLEGTFRLLPASAEHSPSDGEVLRAPEPDPEVYASRGPWPPRPFEVLGVGRKHGRSIVLVALYPLAYFPQSGAILYFESMEVKVFTRADPAAAGARADPSSLEDLASYVDNPPSPGEARDGSVGGGAGLEGGGGGDEDLAYAIVTTAQLASAFEPLRAARTAGGLPAQTFTMEWIRASYDGGRPDGGADDATRLRNFIAEYYQDHGLQYVLLGGDADGDASCPECGPIVVPSRYLQSGALFASSIPSDMYFGCLDGTFDGDRDGVYGEPTDGEEGGDVDFLFEVHVGRAPVDSEAEAASFVRKTLEYEVAGGSVLREVLFVGEYLGFGGEYDWGGNLNDMIRDGSNRFLETTGFLNSPYREFFQASTLYDRDDPGRNWAPPKLIDLFRQGVHIVNHVGHADSTTVMKLASAEIDALSGSSYFFGYTQSCYAGSFDNQRAGGDHGPDSVVEHFLVGPSGAVAFIANSRRGWAGTTYADGPSQRFNRRFWHAVLARGILQVGGANDRSKEDSLADIAANARARWCAYELNTLGDPALTLRFATRKGSVAFDRDWYNVPGTARFSVIDGDLNSSPDLADKAVVRVRAPSTLDEESMEVVETGRSSGVFEGSLPLVRGTKAGDGRLQVEPPDVVTASYADADDGTGRPGTAAASAEVTGPLEISSPCPPDAAIGVPYGFRIEAEGGLAPYRYSSEAGYVEEAGSAHFEGLGVRQNWKTDEGAWAYALPFEFPFYGGYHDSVLVSANGYLDVGGGHGLDFNNSVERLIQNRRIAVLWADLVTAGSGDIYIHERLGSVTIRWLAYGYHTEGAANCEVELFQDGSVRFGYGAGNVALSPTIGVSAGDGERYVVSTISGDEDLDHGPSVWFYPTRLPSGLHVDEVTGSLSGIPAEVTSDEVSLRVEDSTGQYARKRCLLNVRPDGLALEAPRAGDLWLAGTEQTIRWQWFGSVGSSIRLDYSTDGSPTSFPLPIAAGVALDARSHAWRLPGAAAPIVRIRIQSVEKPEFFTYSEIFSIVGPTIVLVSPKGGERWVVGTHATVRWERIGDTGARVRILYSIDGSTTSFPLTLAADAPNTGSFAFTVPSTSSEQCRVKVESISSPSVGAVSPGAFSIRPPSIALSFPNGGECLRIGETINITWSGEGDLASQVILEFNTDGGTTSFPYKVPGSPFPNGGSAAWTIPDVALGGARLRIRTSTAPVVSDICDGSFSIAARCNVRAVIWTPYIDVDEEQVVGIVAALRRFDPEAEVFFSSDETPAALSAALEGKDAFVVPKQKQGSGVDFEALGQSISEMLRSFLARGGAVVFTQQVPASEPLLRATGLLNFSLAGQGTQLCEVTQPFHPVVEGVRPNFSGPRNTAWYSVDAVSEERLVDAGEGNTVVAAREHGFGRLAFLGFDYFDWNDATGRILANSVKVPLPTSGLRFLDPAPGNVFMTGEEIPIRWVARGEARGRVALRANLEGSSAEFPVEVGQVVMDGDEGQSSWTAPSIPSGRVFLPVVLAVQSVDAPQYLDIIEGPLYVMAPLVISTASLPEGNVGLAYRFELAGAGGVPPYQFAVSARYPLPEGLVLEKVDDDTAAIVGSPQRPCDSCEVEILLADSLGASTSKKLRLPVVLREIKIEAPRAGALWLYGSIHDIVWTVTGQVGSSVHLSYNTDGSVADFPFEIAASAPIDAPHTWALPSITAPRCRVKVQSNETPEFVAVSGVFSIVGPSIRLVSPNGDECWEPGKKRKIEWQSASTAGETVRVEYSTDGSTTEFPNLIAEAAPDTGELDWIVADSISDGCRFKVSFTNAPAIQDTSDGPFRIASTCRLNGLLWSPCPGLPSSGDIMVNAIKAVEPDFQVTSSSTSSAGVLSALLEGADVLVAFLAPECALLDYDALGDQVKGLLFEFVDRGGVVILAGLNPSSRRLLEGLGLVDEIAVHASGQSIDCRVSSHIHPLVRGVPLEFIVPSLTTTYVVEGGGFESIVEASGVPVVLARDGGLGRWVILGFDYDLHDPASARILANAARMRPAGPGLRLISPRADAIFFSGQPVPIQWAARGESSGALKISCNTDGSDAEFPLEIARVESGPAGGSHVWIAPEPPAGDHFPCRLKIEWLAEPALPAVSESVFHVVREPLSVTTETLSDGYQNAEYRWEVRARGGALPYAFDASGLHAGLNLASLGPSVPAAEIAGVPVETGTDKVVTISVRDSLGLEATRDFTLNVLPSTIEILAPAGGDYILSGSTYEIRWRVQGYAGETFQLEYNLDGSARDFPEVIAESAAAGSDFLWAVPAVTSGTCRMRIKSNEFPSLSTTMERTFSLAASGVECLYPNGSELLETETTRTLRWRSLGNLAGKVRIDLSADGSSDVFPHVIAEEAPDRGLYSWNVPRMVSEACRVRVRFVDAPEMQDVSDGPFAIRYRSRARGLVWIPHTGFEEMEVRGAVAAITLYETDFHWSFSKAMKPEQLESELHGKETFIMVEQKSAEANFKALGRSLGPVLEEFVTRGGTVVVLKQVGAARDFLPATKLLEAAEAGKAFDVPCHVVWPDHPVVVAVPRDFSAGTSTAWYQIPEGGADVYAATAEGMPVILGRDIGDGRVVLVGFDYRDYNPSSARVLANAVRNTPFAERPRFVRGDANTSGTVDIGDAIFILNYLFKGGPPPACMDAADADDSAEVAGAFAPIDLTDALLLIRWLFFAGQPPAPPTPLRIRGLAEFCGVDPQLRDDLDCGTYSPCEP